MAPTDSPASSRPRHPVGVSLAAIIERTGARLQVAPDQDLPPAADFPAASGVGDLLLTGITLRAQDARPGDLFAALPGTRAHGAQYARDAVAAGAVAVLTDAVGADALRVEALRVEALRVEALGVEALGSDAVGADAPEVGAVGSDALTSAVQPANGPMTHGVPVLVAESPRSLLGEIAREIYGDPSGRLAVIGITGTSGKTTTCYLLEAALAADGSKTGLIGTVQTRIDGEVAPSALTTPEAPDLQALFAVMLERGVSVVAMEVSSHALSLGRVSGTAFAIGAFTNLSQDHLDFHHDMEEYFAAKALLFDGRAQRHVIDVDDPYGARLAAAHPAALTVSAAGKPAATWSVTAVQVSTTGIQHVTLRGPGEKVVTLDLALPGAFNVANAALAIACIDGLGRDVQQAADALAGVVVPGRMERVDAGQDFMAVVDYAHKPAAIAAVLDAIRDGLTGRLIVVVGAGGDRDTGKRPVMGAEAATRADLLIVTDDNPRSEDPAEIRSQVLAGAARGPADAQRWAEVVEIGDRRAAIRAAVAAARTGDAVVIAGKGHELGQDVAGVVHPFSDRVELMTALTELPTSVHAVTLPTPPPATLPTPPPATLPTPPPATLPTPPPATLPTPPPATPPTPPPATPPATHPAEPQAPSPTRARP